MEARKTIPMVPARALGQLASAMIEDIDDDGVVYVSVGGGEAEPARIAAMPGLALAPGQAVLVLIEAESPVIVSPLLARLAGPPPFGLVGP